MEDTIVYLPVRETVRFHAIFPIVSITLGVVAIMGPALFCLLSEVVRAMLPSFGLTILVFIIVLARVGLSFIMSGASALKERSTGKEWVALSQDTFTYNAAPGETMMRLADIVGLEGFWTPPDEASADGHSRPGYWTFIVSDRQNQAISFKVGQEKDLFDARPIFTDLLARLPATLPVHPYLADYVQTGQACEPSLARGRQPTVDQSSNP